MKKLIVFICYVFFHVQAFCQWTQTGGPQTGAILCYTSSPQFLFCGTYGAGVYKSSDNGVSWQSSNNGMLSAYIADLAFSNGHLIAATSNGVYVSNDNGDTWEVKNNGLTALSCYRILIAGTTTYLALSNTLYKSTDWGESWSLTNYSATPSSYISGLFIKNNNLYCCNTLDGLKRSSDNGTTWTSLNTGLPTTNIYGMGTDGNSIFVCLYNDEVYKSTNNGSSWTYSGNGLLSGMIITKFEFSGNIIFGATSNGIAISNDNGANWTLTMEPLNRSIETIYKLNNRLFASSYEHTVFYNYRGGNYFSDNSGQSWTRSNSGIINSNIIEFKVDGDMIIAGSEGGTFISHDHGNTWDEVSYSNQYFRKDAAQSIEIKDSLVFIGTIENRVYRSIDRGLTWNIFGNGMSGYSVSCIKLMGNKVFALTENGINKSTTLGTSWTTVSTGISGLTYNTIEYQGENLFVGTNSGLIVSTDSGATWNTTSNSIATSQVYCLKSLANKLYACTSTGIYLSIDSGNNWTNISSIITQKLAVTTNAIYTNTKYSTDDGLTWVSLPYYNAPFSLPPFSAPLAADSTNLYIGLLNLGVWKLSTINLTGIVQLSTSQSDVSVYPNPVSNELFIRSDIQIERITLYNQVLLELDNRTIESTSFSISTADLANGIYFLKIYTPQSSIIKKVIVSH